MKFTLYISSSKGDVSNCLYPNKVDVVDKTSFLAAVEFDHVSGSYKDFYRSNDNFIEADNIVLDCDNDHSDDPKDWVGPEDIVTAFPGVAHAIAYSRNHQKQKGQQAARPRFHVYFITPRIKDPKEHARLKHEAVLHFPFFDRNALDNARLIFATDKSQVKLVQGDINIKDFLEANSFEDWEMSLEEIPEGKRNTTMSHFAGRIIKRFGDTEEAHGKFLKQAEKCKPALDEKELGIIWASAVSFGKKLSTQEDYIPPDKYNSQFNLKPAEYSDIGQAQVFVREYEGIVRYSPSTKFLVYKGGYWEESDLKAQGLSQDLANRQVEEADILLKKAREEMRKNGALGLLDSLTTKKTISLFNKHQAHSYNQYLQAESYKKYGVKRGDTRAIHATTKEAMPMLEIEQKDLDQNEFLLNTPSYTIDLRTGEKLEHDPLHFITKQTAVDPDRENLKLWLDALDVFFLGDKELIEYVQKVAGLAVIGKVYEEAMIIAYGDGRNGKSTFWNAIAGVLGNYSGAISADILTVGCKRNAKPELAEARGKRLLIAAELEEGMRLSTSNVKQLSSTDEINAEKKYKAPFKFVPSHTLVLYTNHLPKVGAIDEGTWRRLIVIPFRARLEGSSDIKNYGDYLFTKAGGGILSWLIEGAKKAIKEDYKISKPQIVQDAIGKYRESNDWFNHFIIECCEVGDGLEEKSGELYQEYRAFCFRTGEYTRSTADFYTALESEGFQKKRRNNGRWVLGLRLKSEFE